MSFVGEPRHDENVERMYATDLRVQGYVANQTRVWAHPPETIAAHTYALSMASDASGLDARQRTLLVVTTASAMGARINRSSVVATSSSPFASGRA